MVTRIPPMIAIEPTAPDPHCTILDNCNGDDTTPQSMISTRPILYFSYEGQVAVQGIIATNPSKSGPEGKTSTKDDDNATGNLHLMTIVRSKCDSLLL